MAYKQSGLTVITKARELCFYVLPATGKSPKWFCFTMVARCRDMRWKAWITYIGPARYAPRRCRWRSAWICSTGYHSVPAAGLHGGVVDGAAV